MDTGSVPQQPPRNLVFSDNSYSLPPPPQRQSIPLYHHPKRKASGRNRCCKCMCWTCFVLLIIFVLLAVTLLCIYAFFHPQLPSYKINNFEVRDFAIRSDLTLYTEFVVSVKADNPNKNIGFVYGKDSSVIVSSGDSILCSGKLPAFHQPKKNVTMIDLDLKGENPFGSGLYQALVRNRQNRKIPLSVVVKLPVVTVLGHFRLKQVVAHGNCSLVVDNLSPGEPASILSSTCAYSISL